MHEFERVALLTALTRGLHHDLHRAPVREQPNTIVPALIEPHLVKQLRCGLEVEIGPFRSVVRFEQGTSLVNRVVSFGGKPLVDDLVDLVPINRHGNRTTKPDVSHHLAPFEILHVKIGKQRDV